MRSWCGDGVVMAWRWRVYGGVMARDDGLFLGVRAWGGGIGGRGGGGLHGFHVDGEVVDGEEFGFVEDHFLARSAHDVVEGGEFDGVYGAGFFAHATEDAAELINFELGGVFFSVVPGRFCGFDVDAVCWANCWAHHAGDAFDST